MSSPFEERRRDVEHERVMAEIHAWNMRGRLATARDRLEQETRRAYIRRAAAAEQITEREFHTLHGWVSAQIGYITAGHVTAPRVVKSDGYSLARTLGKLAESGRTQTIPAIGDET